MIENWLEDEFDLLKMGTENHYLHLICLVYQTDINMTQMKHCKLWVIWKTKQIIQNNVIKLQNVHQQGSVATNLQTHPSYLKHKINS